MKPALLVIDVQQDFFKKPVTAQSLNDAIEYINAAIALFREKKLPVICVQDIEEEAGRVPGTEAFDLPESLQIIDSDIHIHKTYSNSFTKTPLLETLRKLGVDTVIITGYCAEYCVMSTCRGARDADLTSILLRGAIASDMPERIQFVENVNEVISFMALKKVLN